MFLRRYATILFLLLLICCVSLLVSLNKEASLYGMSRLFEWILFGMGATQMFRKNGREVLVLVALCYAIGMLVTSLLAIGQVLHQGSLGGIWYFLGERTFTAETPGIANASINGVLVLRPYASFPHPNVLAWYLLFGIALCLTGLEYVKALGSKVFLCTVSFLASGVLLLTLSRSVIMLFLCFLLLLPLRLLKNLRKGQQISYFVGVLVLVFFLAFLTPFSQRVMSLFTGDTALSVRSSLLAAAWGMIARYPVTGVGIDNFLVQLQNFSTDPSLPIQPVHMTYALVLSETGIIGFGIFVWLLWTAVIQAFSILSPFFRSVMVSLLVGFLAVGFVDHYFLTLEQGQLLTTLLFSMSFAFGEKRTRKSKTT